MKTSIDTQHYLLELGDKIVELRAEKDITQEELSELLNCSVKTISAVENGKVSPKITFIISLADCFDKNPDYFLPKKGGLKTCQPENKLRK
ncbi:MAG: helix-turn-helix transcriptional regulator [Lachnospiraceae bacterium]|nr:helix-turn-helix transcriptional regulator [Lachnospiraceae bacterium]